MKILKTFENFTKEEVDELIRNKDTYIERNKKKPTLLDEAKYIVIKSELKNLDINKFDFKYTDYEIYIIPSIEFNSLITDLNKTIEEKIDLPIELSVYVDKNDQNKIDFTEGLPPLIIGTGLGYKIYKKIISKKLYITGNKFATIFAYNVWYNLIQDKSLYAFTSKELSGVILKTITNYDLKLILDSIKDKELIFDEELKEKIIEIYGSMDIYKQKN